MTFSYVLIDAVFLAMFDEKKFCVSVLFLSALTYYDGVDLNILLFFLRHWVELYWSIWSLFRRIYKLHLVNKAYLVRWRWIYLQRWSAYCALNSNYLDRAFTNNIWTEHWTQSLSIVAFELCAIQCVRESAHDFF